MRSNGLAGRPALDLRAGLAVLTQEVQHLDPPRTAWRPTPDGRPATCGSPWPRWGLASPVAARNRAELAEPDPVESLDRGPHLGGIQRSSISVPIASDGDRNGELEDGLPRQHDPHRRRRDEGEDECRADDTIGRLGDQPVAHAARAARTGAAYRCAGVGDRDRVARRDQRDADQERSQAREEHRHDEQRRAVPAEQDLHDERAPDGRPRRGRARHRAGPPPVAGPSSRARSRRSTARRAATSTRRPCRGSAAAGGTRGPPRARCPSRGRRRTPRRRAPASSTARARAARARSATRRRPAPDPWRRTGSRGSSRGRPRLIRARYGTRPIVHTRHRYQSNVRAVRRIGTCRRSAAAGSRRCSA